MTHRRQILYVVRPITTTSTCFLEPATSSGHLGLLHCDHLQKAYQLFKTLPPSEIESQHLQQLSGQCGIDLVDTVGMGLWVHDKVVSLALDVEKMCAALSDDLIHGHSLLALGVVLHQA